MTKYSIAGLLLLLFSASASAEDIYFCDSGDDANPGTETSPMKSFDKVMNTFRTMDGGDTIKLCRGGEFEFQSAKKLFNYSCSAESVCTITDYGSASASNPLITYTGTGSALWFTDGPSGNKPDGGYTVSNINLTTRSGETGFMISNDVDDITLESIRVEGFRVGINLAGSPGGGGGNAMNDRTQVLNSVITNNRSQGLVGACNDCLIANNHFENNGFNREIFDHNFYLGSRVVHKNVVVKDNLFYKSTSINGLCKGTSVVVHGLFDGLTIEDNIVKEDVGAVHGLCFGISVNPGYSDTDESFKNVTIKGNQVLNVGSIGIKCASCENAEIVNNTVIDNNGVMDRGIVVPENNENTVKSKNVLISGNKVYQVNTGRAGIVVGGQHPFVVTNNDVRVSEGGTCIDRSEANATTDISTNQCALYGDPVDPIDPVDPEVPSEKCLVNPTEFSSQALLSPLDRLTNLISSGTSAFGTSQRIQEDGDELMPRIEELRRIISEVVRCDAQ